MQDLLNAHNEIACYVAEVENKAKWQHSLEGALRSLQLQNNSLTAELARARSTRESMASSAEALNHMEALEAKVIQLEQSHATQEQLIDELRIAETKLSMVEDTVRENESRIEQLQDSVEEWRRRFEEVSQENETLHRANEEVQNLERAINEINTEKQDYYQQLGDVMEEKRQLIASRDHLFKRLNEANAHIDMLQTKLCRTTEARTMSTMRIVEMEADIRRLNAKLASLEAQAAKSDNNDEESYAAALETENAVPKEQMEGMSSSTSSSDARLLDLEKADACKPIVQAEQTNSAEKNEGVTLEPGSTANNLADSVNEMQRTIAALTEQLRIAQDTIETASRFACI
ncbi:unnamed protein product [Toxocara canis]|uniref:L27 domain-containing protein n=1 Tax=Toxocara canis TaxID=6265 RepID=A0A3P7FRA6_TOXCA|nr:unnamed protein product [Toxocara canis]